MSGNIQLVWFKRDLRLLDNEAVYRASQLGPCIFLYIIEEEIINSEDCSAFHYQFIRDSLVDLRRSLEKVGATLLIRRGSCLEVFEKLYESVKIQRIHSHQETGNDVTYRRDQKVKAWTKHHQIDWIEYRQHGVVRRLSNRNSWSSQWLQLMRKRSFSVPTLRASTSEIKSERIPETHELFSDKPPSSSWRSGGEQNAYETLETFLESRGKNYQREMSSPLTAQESCSRLSAFIAYGNISMRTVFQRIERQKRRLRNSEQNRQYQTKAWLNSLTSYEKRLRWHCHFIQKLEDEPRIEFENMSRSYDGLRENEFNNEFFDAWKNGTTGFPMVDACIRCLQQTGWINFRMRAMLVSFASYHLWLHWRPTSVALARWFTDYEPGIHYPQFQMQSGTTGINALRIYSPSKQVRDHDPEGVFIRRWLPELEAVPREFIADPSKMSLYEQQRLGCIIGKNYPSPIVNELRAIRTAHKKIGEIRKQSESKAEARKVFVKHGSRRRPQRNNQMRRKRQLGFDL
ncbi:MAG: FAD-binding domain-containing protein [Myxococcota bacterium]|nr:FAD-binding domain-containing protein [Myxococcota bacterium]